MGSGRDAYADDEEVTAYIEIIEDFDWSHKPSKETLRQWSTTSLKYYGRQSIDMSLAQNEWLQRLKIQNWLLNELGVRWGWWDDYTDDGIQIKYQNIKASDYLDKTMAHIMSDLKIFPSISQAKKNGWDRPVSIGIYKVGKSKVVRVE
jgi:hypothetical protein